MAFVTKLTLEHICFRKEQHLFLNFGYIQSNDLNICSQKLQCDDLANIKRFECIFGAVITSVKPVFFESCLLLVPKPFSQWIKLDQYSSNVFYDANEKVSSFSPCYKPRE